MPAPTHRSPPLVRVSVRGVRLHGYLLAWVEPNAARVGRVEQYETAPGQAEPYQWRWVEEVFPAGAVETIVGQSYVLVPRG